MTKVGLRYFGHVKRRCADAPKRICEKLYMVRTER